MEDAIFRFKHQWDCPSADDPHMICWTYSKKLDSSLLKWQSVCLFTSVAICFVNFIVLVCAVKRLRSKFSNLGRFFLAIVFLELFSSIPFNLTPYPTTALSSEVMEVDITRDQDVLVMSSPRWMLWDQHTTLSEDCRTMLTDSCYCNETTMLINSVDDLMDKHISLEFQTISLNQYHCMMTQFDEIEKHTKDMAVNMFGKSFILLIF